MTNMNADPVDFSAYLRDGNVSTEAEQAVLGAHRQTTRGSRDDTVTNGN
jgi:hypothetical protein